MFCSLLIALLQAAAGDPQIDPSTAVPATSPAAEQPAAAPAPAARPANAREALHCHNEAMTGSRLGRRVCRTKADEDRAADDSRKMLERLQGARVPSAN